MRDLLPGANGTICTVQYHLRHAHSDVSMISTDGIRNVIVHGRAVYYAIQRDLKGNVEPDFMPWCKIKNDEMSDDELMSLFRDMRNELLKEGVLPAVAEFPGGFVFSGDTGYFGASPPPPGKKVTGQILGQQFGGLVWETTRPDGTVEYFPARLPPGQAPVLYPERTKVQHLGTIYEKPTLIILCDLYVSYLERLIAEAKRTFRLKPGLT